MQVFHLFHMLNTVMYMLCTDFQLFFISGNEYTRVQFWREKMELTRSFKVGDFITVYAALTARYRSDHYINSLDDTEVKVN